MSAIESPNNSYKYPAMKAHHRAAILAIWNGDNKHFHEIMHALHFIDCYFPSAKIEAAYSWLISNRIIGTAFYSFVYGEHNGAMLEVQRTLLSRIEGLEKRPIIAGKDFRV